MPNIDSSQARRFSNERLRPAANKVLRAYRYCQQVLAEWYGGQNAEFPNTEDRVIDGSIDDGRPIYTGTDANNAMATVAWLCGGIEENSNARLTILLKVADNTTPEP